MKAGVSLQSTIVLPRMVAPKSIIKSITSGFVFGVGIISRSFKYLGGLKKCVPKKCCLKSSLLLSNIVWIGIPDVLEVIKVPSFLYFSTLSKTIFFISSRSTTTSMIQSQEEIKCISSDMLPVLILLAKLFL